MDIDDKYNCWKLYDNQEHILYSSGGIKVMKYNENLFQELAESDTSWIPISNPEVIPGDISQNVWSLVIDRLGFLWVLTDKGVQGYEIDGSSEIILRAIRRSVDENGIESPYNYGECENGYSGTEEDCWQSSGTWWTQLLDPNCDNYQTLDYDQCLKTSCS